MIQNAAELAVVVDATKFIASSKSSCDIFKTATLLKSLTVNSFIYGDVGVGKKSLARYILPDAPILDAFNSSEILKEIDNHKEIIILNFNNLLDSKNIFKKIISSKIRIIAISSRNISKEIEKNIFSIVFEIPPLSKRKEDVNILIDMFNNEAISLFGDKKTFSLENFTPDLSKNGHSLKKQVYLNYLFNGVSDKEIMLILEKYLSNRIGSGNDYKNNLHIYEVPLIKAGFSKFKSQMKISNVLGINRNTLRSKINDNKKYLKKED